QADSSTKNRTPHVTTLAELVSSALSSQACCIWRMDPTKKRILNVMATGFPEEVRSALSSLDSETSHVAHVMQSGQPQFIPSLTQHTSPKVLPNKAQLHALNLNALLSVPLSDAEPGGAYAISVYRSQKPFLPKEARLLAILGQHVLEAITKLD